jgi:hypothetical protein
MRNYSCHNQKCRSEKNSDLKFPWQKAKCRNQLGYNADNIFCVTESLAYQEIYLSGLSELYFTSKVNTCILNTTV